MREKKIVINPFFYPQDDAETKQILDEIENIIKKLDERKREIKETCPHTKKIDGHLGILGEPPNLEFGPICAKCRNILVD
ncbi:TPA: hypothetical protein DCZ46_03155 [Candidatus Campbellbacteria bacterium]|nr:MAG: coiled-coil [Candidatus Campbellbacteria bacterium GW2011_OD1_34_28]KKP74872.1 MAG: hypothetical protein UR74_C0002G0138 [Candidatus Campbellbacteria bacterium GW2011_GWD2_35_24]KKP75758.1 MAG: hypothetical protein UR75_C0002G0139 [Candidatus Campbellbacteria bacterium GW2011_GWC2_35_28]KKP76994.1 MAG: hypothetical protein UR76_C0002G0195 [Candidatus Campbellbacteria bacterium GW2011_GWC1_35_31]KKP78920.1 MAG: hypothetical protein UR79_C0002G0195 [Candidatus Campbellbacteria bacterium G